ncbi:MAG: GTP cyclohydrolase FolE2 [Actinomycetota bacterium]|nr:GTP cyclohydrolase FolE2 [Actinomycetota bacterium]
MNPPSAATLPDAQAQFDARGIEIDEVGVDRLSYPITYLSLAGTRQSSVAEAELVASLDADARGTHMSRFVEALHAHRDGVVPETPLAIAQDLRNRLGARRAAVQMRFTLFLEREAPVTGAAALMGYACRLWGSGAEGEPGRVRVGVRVPVTSLCPCSKDISDYGAHSQRGYVEVSVEPEPDRPLIWPEELIEVASGAGSAPVYPLLKRVDEREVTMLAYDNPAFVEDVARDVAVALTADERVRAFDVQVANEESIHDHRAIARVRWRRRDA